VALTGPSWARTLDDMKSLHLIGIAGTGMGAFAGLLKQAGYDVRGSDQNVYPPMSHKLADWGIAVAAPYAAENLEPTPDLVVVGNVIRKDNVEAVAMRERGLAHASFPETLGRLFLARRHSVVVAGTHGKTTTTTLLAHALLAAGRDPGFLVGGIPHGLGESFRTGAEGAPFVVEGDEYDTAYFDKGPKFLHYRPRSLLLTSLEYDHADIYADVEQIKARFEDLLRLVPEDGHIVAFAQAPHLREVLARAAPSAALETYGPGGEVCALDVSEDARGVSFVVQRRGATEGPLFVPLSGEHGVDNALGAYAVLRGLGLSYEQVRAGFASFAGVKRRLEVVGEAGGVTVVDDFAHHPTAVDVTLKGARRRYAGRELWALFEPRSATSCRRIFQDDYARAFDAADHVLLAPPGRQLDPAEALHVPTLAEAITQRGSKARACESLEQLVSLAASEAAPGAVLLCMSNGAFGGVHQRLLTALEERAS
jgi:UDP-N-acetylmuramate: L-alanyl-gamma-D-glutamyl-meso-diaminopimelate ligase